MAVALGKVGVWTPSPQWPAAATRRAEAAALLEELGFGAAWLGVASADLELPAAILGATRRLAAGTSVLNVWTEPAGTVTARYAALPPSVRDRLVLGVGAGHRELLDPTTGPRYERPYSKVVAYLDALDAAGVPASARAVAALGPRMLVLAATRSAGPIPYLVTPDHTGRARDMVGPGVLLAPEQKVVLETDPARARRIARDRLEFYFGLPNYTNNLLRLGFTPDDFAGGGSDRLVDALVAWGDPATVVARLDEHFAAGADHVAVQVLAEDPDRLPVDGWRTLAAALR